MSGCSIEGCPRPHKARGLCGTHVARLYRHGTTDDPLPGPSLEERFWPLVVKGDGCWRWLGPFTSEGYARFAQLMGHRVAYEAVKGPIPEGRHLDHLCRNRACVNPDHLEPVTPRENILRGVGPSAMNAKKTHCEKGHELAGKNLYWSSGHRRCRACRVEKERVARRKRREHYAKLLRVVEAAASLHRTIAPVERKMLGERSEDKLGILGNALKALEG